MTFSGLIAGILLLFCWCIKSEAKTIDCPGVTALDRKGSDFFNYVYGKKYWTVKKTGETEYEFHPLGIYNDTLVKLSFLKLNQNYHEIINYYNDPASSEDEMIINKEIYSWVQVDDTKIIYKTFYKESKLFPERWLSGLHSPKQSYYNTQIYSNYEFALIDQKDNYNVLIFKSCDVDEPDTWTLISDKKLCNATAPDGSLNAEIGGIHVDHMPKLLYQPVGLDYK